MPADRLSFPTMIRQGEKSFVSVPGHNAIPVALVYPNVYRVGMANLGFQHLYRRLNEHRDFFCERFFLPDERMAARASARLLSEESDKPLRDFAVIAFSIPFEADYAAVPPMLALGGIPPLREARGPSDPLVIAGGVSVSMNPEPLADFLDLAYIGEIDEQPVEGIEFPAVPPETRHRYGRSPWDKETLARSFQSIPGAYVPSAYRFTHGEDGCISGIQADEGFPARVKAVKRRGKTASVPVSVLFTPQAEFGEALLVETNRGCARGCRFCVTGAIHLPVRYARFERFRDEVRRGIKEGRTIGLIGSDLAGHPDLEDILRDIVAQGGRFSLSSIRPEGLTPGAIALLAQTGQKTATLAPETASPRMKRVIGKDIPSERFVELVEKLVSAGIPNIRFYFMVGLPTETDDDADAIVEEVLASRRAFVNASRSRKRIGTLSVQLNPFVPKPWTPFQWAAMARPEIIEARIRSIRAGLKKTPNVVVRSESTRLAVVQALLSRADRTAGRDVLELLGRAGGASALSRKEKAHLDFHVFRERFADEIFPWEVTDHGVRRESLRRSYEEAMREG